MRPEIADGSELVQPNCTPANVISGVQLARSKVLDANLEHNSGLYNGLVAEAFSLLTHFVVVILRALGLFTNGQLN